MTEGNPPCGDCSVPELCRDCVAEKIDDRSIDTVGDGELAPCARGKVTGDAIPARANIHQPYNQQQSGGRNGGNPYVVQVSN